MEWFLKKFRDKFINLFGVKIILSLVLLDQGLLRSVKDI
jgi:hypothetical protein